MSGFAGDGGPDHHGTDSRAAGHARWLRVAAPSEILDHEAVIWAAAREELVHLNREATLVWERLALPASPQELAEVAVAAGCPAPRAEADVRHILEHLDAHGLIRPAPHD